MVSSRAPDGRTPLADSLLILEQAELISLATARPEPQFTFRHALVQQAAYNTYLKNQRRRVHQVIAEVLERNSADPSQANTEPADLAYHYSEAGAWARAMVFAQQAGERAQAQYAHRESIQHYTLALEAAAALGQAPPFALWRSRGLAFDVVGDFARAQADYEHALAQARATGPWRDEAQMLLDLGLLWASRDYARTGAYYREALELARRHGDDYALAHSLNRLGNWHFNRGENLAALGLHQEALTIFKRLEARRGLAETFDLLGMVQTVIGRIRQGKASYEQAITLFREQDDQIGLISCLATLSEQGPSIYTDTTAYSAPRDEAVAHGREALKIAQQIGFRAGEAYALCSLCGLLIAQGEYETALPDIRRALQIAEEIDHRQWQAFALTVYSLACLDLFQMGEARQHVERAYAIAQEVDSAIWIAGSTGMLALTYLERGEVDLAEALLARHPTLDDSPSLQERMLACMRAEVMLAQGQPAAALDVVKVLIATTPEIEPGQVIPRLWHLRGRVWARLGQWEEGTADLRAACAGSLANGTRPLVWRIQADLARLYDARGMTVEAEAQRTAAHKLVAALADSVPDAAWRTHFREQARRRIEQKD